MNGERGAIGNIIAVVLGGSAAAGLIVGALLGVTGTASLVGEPATLADAAVASYYDCPDGAALGTVTRGDRVLITGRDASGDWAEIRSPLALNSRVWMRAAQVLPDGDTADLPVFSCNVPVEVIAATVTTTTEAPDTTTETTEATATTQTTGTTQATATTQTTATTQATATTGTTAPPADTTPPLISNPAASPVQIWEQDGLGISCPGGTPRQSIVSATVTDAGGVASVTASWNDPLGSHNVAMSVSGSTYSTTIGPYAAGTWPDGSNSSLPVTILAVDGSGIQSSSLAGFAIWSIAQCFV